MAISNTIQLIKLKLHLNGYARSFKYIMIMIYVGFMIQLITYISSQSTEQLRNNNKMPLTGEKVTSNENDYMEIPQQVLKFEGLVRPGLGDSGKEVHLPQEQSSADIETQMKLYSFNKFVSDKISVRRHLPDVRHEECKTLNYDKDLPKASVILIFCNESLSALMRTVHSVIDQTPPTLLHEVVLIDDGSGSEEIVEVLPLYLTHRFKDRNVHLHRTEKQTGLIAARLAGAEHSNGDVIVYLDSHCEATPGWYEPLAQHIKYNPSAIAIPSIDSIDHTTLEFRGHPGGIDISVGGFTWSGHFTWENYRSPAGRRASDPAPTPTMAGGLFAMDRKFFWKIGGYDAGMVGWGGENLELSFRSWQCGGRMDSIPCSHVGHIFRPTHPYYIPNDSHGKNTIRMAEVWMDDYKRLYYLHRPDLKSKKVSDVGDRIALKKKLNCKSFSWFLKNVIPHKFILDEDTKEWGRFRSGKNPNICIDHLQLDKGHHLSPYYLGQYNCLANLVAPQFFSISKNNELRNEYYCAEVRTKDKVPKIYMYACHGGFNQKWERKSNNAIRNIQSGKCLTSPSGDPKIAAGQELLAKDCDGSSEQVWKIEFIN